MENVGTMSNQATTPKKSTIVRKKPPALVKAFWRALNQLAPGLAGWYFERAFFTPQRYPIQSREKEILDRADQQWVEVNGHRLAVWRWSIAGRPRAPAIVLMHGWAGRAGQMTPFVQPLLDAGFAVWAFDGPGHGKSTGRFSSGVMLAQALLTLSDEWGPPAGIIAHSIGGWAAAHAMHLGAPFPRAVLISPPNNPAEFLKMMSQKFRLTEAGQATVMTRAEKRLGLKYEQFPLAGRVHRLDAQALVIHDRQDRDIEFSAGQTVAQAWPGAETHWTEGLGHRRILRDPAVIQRAVAFLRTPA